MDVETRWNSSHDMCKDALRTKKTLTAISVHLYSNNDRALSVLDNDDWDKIEKITLFLEPFEQGKYLNRLNFKSIISFNS